ncbi:DHH family phosphoesterase [Halapricum hydrolyticum]|uniref:DHH family phosphoesterase n=1 Tax=Halapricum hydrolyticum TaxID=2979991 RepID=A0AAE3IAT1_9EURY|nr:DHH family phosphoesterase [Halapricum hydrolyticum]MCU4717552.1 DHH family phosphoesterase [Halapricum hydrolyticum]MCU4726716.1 DHH family phosphoesterase [Halapricum hydrolyticum]
MLPGADGGVVSQIDAVVSLLGERPAIAVGAVFVVLVLVAVGWWLFSRWRRSPAARFRGVLKDQDEVAILLHPNPDPDAMASAMGVQSLADAIETDASIQYPGQIRRQENRAFQTVLDQDFERIETAGDLEAETVVLVDHNEPRGFPGADGIDPIAVVDHHPGEGTGETFTDVRPEYGACATIVTEYLDDLGWDPTDMDDGPTVPDELATGLLYGIQSDTKHLTKGCSPAEFDAAGFLYRGVDEELLDRVANPEVDAEVLEVKARAITSRDVRNAFAVSDVEDVGNVDAIPQAAEELLRLEGVTAIVVFGRRDGTLHLSGRSRDDRVHMGKALKAAVEDIPMAEAGGHARMGGGQLSIEHMEGLGPGDGLTVAEFRDRLFEAMTGELQ